MAWIQIIGPDEASGRLGTIYDSLGSRKPIDNILTAHSLRPHTLAGHLALYKSVLHHTGNSLPVWFLETIGILVSLLNGCSYCSAHHTEGLRRQLKNDDLRTNEILEALQSGRIDGVFQPTEAAALRYATLLTNDPASVTSREVEAMREAGLSDGEILEVNQVTAYFAYANRTVNGLGVTIDGDDLGLSPSESDDLSNFEHR